MSNIVNVEVTYLTTVLTIYNRIKIYKSDSAEGTFEEITNSSTRPILNTQDTLYAYIDTSGIPTDYYKTSYFNSDTLVESTASAATVATTSNQLLDNMEIIITIAADIEDVDGNSLASELEFSFFTPMTPLYSNIRRIRLEIGSYIQEIEDYTITIAILEASLMADQMTWVADNSTNAFFQFARKEWSTCKASQILLTNTLSNGGLKSKTLDNFSVTYDSKHGNDLLDKIADCLARWEAQVTSGGRAIQTPVMVVKGEYDVDSVNVGRMWESGPYVNKISGANLRYKPTGSRRYIKGWYRNG